MKRIVAVATMAAACLAAQVPEGHFERTLTVSGPADLDVITDAGGIVVRSGPAGTVHVRGLLKGNRGGFLSGSGDVAARIRALEQNPPVQQTGGTIRIGHVADREALRGVQMRLEIEAPAESRLRARADSGGIRVAGIRGAVDAKTDSGGIQVNDAGPDVRVGADSGGIQVRNAGGVVARADSGGIQATGIAGPVDVAVDSGGIRVEQTAAGTIRARTDSGGAIVRLAPGAGYDIRAHSGSGRVTVADLQVQGTLSPHRAEGKVRGGGPLVDVQVDSGELRIE